MPRENGRFHAAGQARPAQSQRAGPLQASGHAAADDLGAARIRADRGRQQAGRALGLAGARRHRRGRRVPDPAVADLAGGRDQPDGVADDAADHPDPADRARDRLGGAVRGRLPARPAADARTQTPADHQHRSTGLLIVLVVGAADLGQHDRVDASVTSSPRVRQREEVRGGQGPVQRAAARRRLRRGPDRHPAGQHHAGQHRREHRPDRADRPAAEHGQVPFPAGTAMDKEFPERLPVEGLRRRTACSTASTPTARATSSSSPASRTRASRRPSRRSRAITGLKVNYYVLIDLAGFQRPAERGRRDHPRRRQAGPDRRHRRADQGLHRAGQNQHLDGYHALWFARSRAGAQRLRADDPAEVRDDRDAEPAVAADGADQVPGHRLGEQGGGQHQHPGRRSGHLHRPRAGLEEAAGVKLLRGPAADQDRQPGLRADPGQGGRGDRKVRSAGQVVQWRRR